MVYSNSVYIFSAKVNYYECSIIISLLFTASPVGNQREMPLSDQPTVKETGSSVDTLKQDVETRNSKISINTVWL